MRYSPKTPQAVEVERPNTADRLRAVLSTPAIRGTDIDDAFKGQTEVKTN